jgi:hypothetical protein
MLFFAKRFLTSICFAQQVVGFTTLLDYPLKTVSMSAISYIDAKTAQTIDERLMKEQGFSLDQLMELAGKAFGSERFHRFDILYRIFSRSCNP